MAINQFKYEVGQELDVIIYGKAGKGVILERVVEEITNMNRYYVEIKFDSGCVNKMWIYESSL